MDRPMRRKDRIMDEGDAWEFLAACEWGTLGLATSDGEPYCVPVNFVCDGNEIFIHCAKEGKKTDMARANGRAFFTVAESVRLEPENFTARYISVMAGGIVSFASEEEKRKALKLFVEKFCPGMEREGDEYIGRALGKTEVMKFTIESISGKKNI